MENPIDTSAYGTHTKPYLANLLRVLNLDYEVLTAKGNKMHIRYSDGKEAEVVDFVGGYGANLLGHRHTEIEIAIKQYYSSGRTNQAQLSLRNKSGALCSELCNLATRETNKNYIATLANTGAEAVEIALRHAKLSWRKSQRTLVDKGMQSFQQAKNQALQSGYEEKFEQLCLQQKAWLKDINHSIDTATPIVVSLEGAYHGKTAAALAVSDHDENESGAGVIYLSREGLEGPIPTFPSIKLVQPVWKSGAIQYAEIHSSTVCAIIAEPLQGEGGVRPLSDSQARALCNLADHLACPLMWDEIQSGCYRSGTLFHSTRLGVAGDYYCLGKALGGGVAKLSAVLISQDQYLPEFDLLHNSTFAEDDFSSEMGLAFLNRKEQIQEKVKELEPLFRRVLQGVQEHFPQIVKEQRGEGLIWALEFFPMEYSGSYSLQALSRSGYFNYMLVAWLLNEGGIRCSAPLSQSFVLRFHADVACTPQGVQRLENALHLLCDILQNQDLYQLLKFSLPKKWQELRSGVGDFNQEEVPREDPCPGIPEVGFITHYIDPENMRKADPSLALLPDDALDLLLNRFFEFLPPILNGSRIVTDALGRQVHLRMIGMAFTSQMAKKAMADRCLEPFRAKVQQSVKMLEDRGCTVIGLGQYSSIITRNGKSLITESAVITTGNGLTVFLAAEALLQAAREKNIDLSRESLALVGGFGNIGSCLLKLLQQKVKEVVVFTGTKRSRNGLAVKMKYDLSDLKDYKLVMLATNSTETLITAGNTAVDAIISDISVPGNVDPELLHDPGLRQISLGGIAHLPDEKGIPSKGFPLPDHLVFGCLSETLVLGLSGKYHLQSLGELDPLKINELGKIAGEAGLSVLPSKPLARLS